MDDWTADQYEQMMRGGNTRWNSSWKEANSTAEFREKQAWKMVQEGEKDRGDMREVVGNKYESEVAERYREILAKKNGVATISGDNNTSSSVQAEVVTLTGEEAPTLEQCKAVSFQFIFSLLTSEPKNLMPLMMLVICGVALSSWVNKHGPSSYKNVLVPSIMGFTSFIPYYFINSMSTKYASDWVNHRLDAFNSARNFFIELITNKKAKRLDTCDVYFPTIAKERTAKAGLIFYPGALVDRTAYAPIASKMADAGIFVVIANLEPFRLVPTLKLYNTKEKVMRMISDALLLGAQDGSGLWEVEQWAIGGHSFGGSLAVAACANEMHSTLKQVVLWGVGSYPNQTMHPCKALRDITSDVDVLVVNGSNDIIMKAFGGKDAWKYMEDQLPPAGDVTKGRTTSNGCTFYATIEGGNHSGCAHYGPQIYPVRDGDRTITLDEQQDQMAELTVSFLLGKV